MKFYMTTTQLIQILSQYHPKTKVYIDDPDCGGILYKVDGVSLLNHNDVHGIVLYPEFECMI